MQFAFAIKLYWINNKQMRNFIRHNIDNVKGKKAVSI